MKIWLKWTVSSEQINCTLEMVVITLYTNLFFTRNKHGQDKSKSPSKFPDTKRKKKVLYFLKKLVYVPYNLKQDYSHTTLKGDLIYTEF